MKLLRMVLPEVEDFTPEAPGRFIKQIHFEGYPQVVVDDHVVQLQEKNYLDAVVSRTSDGIHVSAIHRLTSEGTTSWTRSGTRASSQRRSRG